MGRALLETPASRVLVLNLMPESGETSGYSPERYLEVLADKHPDFRLDAVVADPRHVEDEASLERQVGLMGAQLTMAQIAHPEGATHDPELLASTFRTIFQSGRIGTWR